jgi:hypothetical protein
LIEIGAASATLVAMKTHAMIATLMLAPQRMAPQCV